MLYKNYLDDVLRTSFDLMKENGSNLPKERNRRYPVHTITDAYYNDYAAHLANIPAQVKTLLHNLEWAVGGIGLHANADKTKYTCFNQRGEISTLRGRPLKLVDMFTSLEVVSHYPRKT